MKRSTSFVHGRMPLFSHQLAVEERPQVDYDRFIYINTEEANKEKHTIFHSPYKGGKKNPNYTNPSFMSSDIFYPRDYSNNQHSKSKPKIGLIPTKDDVTKQDLYNQRMLRKSYSGTCLNKNFKQGRQKQFEHNNDQRFFQKSIQKTLSQTKLNAQILRKIQASKQLKQQIQLLRKSPSKSNLQKFSNSQTPIYLQHRGSLMNRMLKKQTSKRQLIDEMSKALKRKQQQKVQKQNDKRTQKTLIDRETNKFYAGVKNSSEYERQKARLLSELLLEQIYQRR